MARPSTQRSENGVIMALIKTIRSGDSYRVTLDSDTYTFQVDPDRTAVFVYSANRNHGGYLIDRFGGELTPAGIRKFLSED